ncbi:hypothetical protein DPMN_025107 [Dreissena polymorpha]|uniref:Uncharacterized protein n=1 Tax=Dreissena polymorpha TaxID=45954 RepID=A0A9D4LQN9_DREPO|nr:hypothetical protein DPMN_025107 [Dreissena polymorpha]
MLSGRVHRSYAHLRGENCPTPLEAMFIDPSGPFANSSDIYITTLFIKFQDDWAKNVTSRVHVIQPTGTIFQLNSRIKETNKNAPPNSGHIFSPIWTIFELVRHINKTNVLINFHDDWANIVTSRVFTMKTAPPTGGHALNVTSTVFKLDRDFVETNLLTKFHEDLTIIECLRTNVDGRTTDKDQSQKLT